MRFSRQEYWRGLPCLSLGDLPDPGIEPASLVSPALAGGFSTASASWEVHYYPVTRVNSLLVPGTGYTNIWEDPTYTLRRL